MVDGDRDGDGGLQRLENGRTGGELITERSLPLAISCMNEFMLIIGLDSKRNALLISQRETSGQAGLPGFFGLLFQLYSYLPGFFFCPSLYVFLFSAPPPSVFLSIRFSFTC